MNNDVINVNIWPQCGISGVYMYGKIWEIILKTIPAPESLGEIDQTEEYIELDMPLIDSIIYIYNAITTLLELNS